MRSDYLNDLIKTIFNLSISGHVKHDDEPEIINERIRTLLKDFEKNEEGKRYIDG